MNVAQMARIREALERYGMLPAHDPAVPSLTNLVAGRPIRGSWWGDPAGRQIYQVLNALAAEVAWPKLLNGKVTLVHRRLWPALAAVGEQEASWQIEHLGEVERGALDVIRERGMISTDDIPLPAGAKAGRVVTELERRLLVIGDAETSEGGHHARTIRTWRAWLSEPRPEASAAVEALEDAASGLGLPGALPWRQPAITPSES